MSRNLINTLQEIWYKNDLVTRANALAFGLLISFIPMILLTILSFSYILPHLQQYFAFSDQDFMNILKQQIATILPIAKNDLEQMLNFLKNNWGQWSNKKILSTSFVLSILYASQAMWLILKSFETQQLCAVRDTRPYIFRRILSLYFTLFILITGMAIIITLFGINILIPKAITLIGLSAKKMIWLKYMKWVATLVLLYILLCVIYKFGNIEKIPFLSWGALAATFSIIAISLALSPLLKKYSTYHLVYGPLSAILLIGIWFQISSFAIFIGQDINIALKSLKSERAKS